MNNRMEKENAPLACGRIAIIVAVMVSLLPGYGIRALASDDTGFAFKLSKLEIKTDSGELPGDEDTSGTLRLTELCESGASAIETPVRIRLRGNTSRRFPKKSYRLRLVGEDGAKRDLDLCSLRADDDWILNPMYSDTSKLREAMAYWLWDQINSQGRAAAGSRSAYVEVWLNGAYHGLYMLQERVDRKQVGADRERGILYKATANDRPDVARLLDAGSADTCGGLELAFAGSGVRVPWEPAADYMAILNGEMPLGCARLSRPNAVDYALWSMLVQARDNHFKNMFIHCVFEDDGYVLYRIPWDLNHTFGDLWDGASPETNYVAYAVSAFALDDGMKALIAADPTLMDDMRARWTELRAGSITEARILDRARGLFDALYPAILRDTQRWPACGMGEGSAANIRDIEDFIRVTLARMDGMLSR